MDLARTEQADLKKSERPDEVREFPGGRPEPVKAGAVIGRAVLEPGWRRATSVKPGMIASVGCEPRSAMHGGNGGHRRLIALTSPQEARGAGGLVAYSEASGYP